MYLRKHLAFVISIKLDKLFRLYKFKQRVGDIRTKVLQKQHETTRGIAAITTACKSVCCLLACLSCFYLELVIFDKNIDISNF